jgi:acyl-coenzyme A thioesterase PaaI-like protein
MWEADQRGWQAEQGAPVPFITAGLEVKFLRPTPLGPVLSFRAEPEKVSESEIVVNAELVFDEKQRATLRAQWLRFRPR